MGPVSAGMIVLMAILALCVFVLKFPALIIGIFLHPLANRFPWVIEFLYPTGLGRWVHFFILRLAQRARRSKPTDKNYGYHSRTIESRIELVKGRVFLHPLPQLMDNLGYLVVCCPESLMIMDQEEVHLMGHPRDRATLTRRSSQRIVGFVVDCGDAHAVMRQVKLISKTHYGKRKIYVQSILSTHKHHDHTAGNLDLMEGYGRTTVKLVFGGAIEKVPGCNFPLSNGDKLPLPKEGTNDMGELIEVEAIATPAHTRGSLAYALRPKVSETSSVSAILFTGDTMFSGGGGVPFESDIDAKQQENTSKMTGNSYIKASANLYATERCFSEILFRCVPTNVMREVTSDRVLIFAGHEYSHDLLYRQFVQPLESNKWKNFSPTVFFETISQYYVALHRRSLPHSSGKLLIAPSPISRELAINPNLRSLKKRGEIVLSAIRLWNRHFSKSRVGDSIHGSYGLSGVDYGGSNGPDKSMSTERRWNLDAKDLNSSVFTTVYSEDLDKVIDDLDAGKIDARKAARQLREIKAMMNIPVIGRRPIPNTLPSERMVYKGLVGFALLGSSPTAMTLSDSDAMKLPAPVDISSDLIRVSKERLISVLYWLGLLSEENEGKRTVAVIEQLWKEANAYESKLTAVSLEESAPRDNIDVELTAPNNDKVDLGSLKWIVYGVPSQRPSYFPKFCMPCAKPARVEDHPMHGSDLKREAGELVRHDIFQCLICKGATGNPCPEAHDDDRIGSTSFLTVTEEEGEGGTEIEAHSLGAILREV